MTASRNLMVAATVLATLLCTAAEGSGQDKPAASFRRGGALTLQASLSHPYILKNKASEMHATVNIRAKATLAQGSRLPLNVALVIDRSTSMRGTKIARALDAANKLAARLGPRDRIAVVSYGNDVSVELEPTLATRANRKRIQQAIAQIEVAGSTNLGGGYGKAVALMRGFAEDERITRVLLLSDGRANVGLTSREALGQLARVGLNQGISLSTVGVGLNYNELLMAHMAREGAGQYYFIDDSDDLAAVFRGELNGLTSTVAKAATLELTLSPGVELLEVYGFAHRTRGNKVTVPLAEFFSRQHKSVLMRLSVSAQGAGVKPIAAIKLRYKDVDRGKRVSARGELKVVATDKVALRTKHVDRQVLKRVQQVQTARSMERAATAYERGDRAKAAKILSAQRAHNREAAKTYDFAGDDAFGRVDGELKKLESSVRTNKAGSDKSKRMKKSMRKRSYDIKASGAAF